MHTTAQICFPVALAKGRLLSQQEINQYLADHHGVISRAEARSLGLSSGQIGARVRTGAWIRTGPGVFKHSAAPRSWFGECRAAALSLDGLASHRAAAAVWKIDSWSARQIDVVVPEGRYRRRRGLTVHQSRQFDLADATVINGVPVTGIARTVLDIAAVTGPRRLEWTLDAVLRQRLLRWPDLLGVLVRHSARGRNGCGKLRALLDERYGEQVVPDSTWNRMVGQLLSDAGLPTPIFEHEIRNARGFVARVDLAYPLHQLAIELDSARFHLNRASFEADPRRKNRLLTEGWLVLTFTWSDFTNEPAELVNTVRAALAKTAR